MSKYDELAARTEQLVAEHGMQEERKDYDVVYEEMPPRTPGGRPWTRFKAGCWVPPGLWLRTGRTASKGKLWQRLEFDLRGAGTAVEVLRRLEATVEALNELVLAAKRGEVDPVRPEWAWRDRVPTVAQKHAEESAGRTAEAEASKVAK